VASYSTTQRTIHKTLAANVEDVVTLTGDFSLVEVLNRGSTALWVRTDNVAVVINADGAEIVPAGSAGIFGFQQGEDAKSTIVRLIAAAACDYSLRGE
jgi:hypothetical protein